MSSLIRAGVVGLGRSGWELHLETISKMREYQVTAVCDQSPQRLARATATFGTRPHASWQSLLADSEVDLVVVAVPGNLHAPIALAALEAGKHVIVEKPMANTLAEADEMLVVARRTGRMLTVFHNRRWDRDYRMVKSLVRTGELGELLTVDCRVMSFGSTWPTYGVAEFKPSWWVQAAYGGGFLADWGPHLVDQCLDLLDAWPTRVVAELRRCLWSKEVDDYFQIRMAFDAGLLVTVEGSNNARIALPRWFVVGTEATLISGSGFGHWAEMRLARGMDQVTTEAVPRRTGDVGISDGRHVADEPNRLFYEDLAEALARGRTPAVSAARARDVIALLDAARQSSELGQTVVAPAPMDTYAQA
jgi:predicted dehydrogenase